ncbi:MAG TPA: iron-containing alcohol dehydrogenase [Solirubrobacteraceae bacterium]|nr:iron-containing alcohol dehydrogenase [Solirubrobacteraceae bacterium]
MAYVLIGFMGSGKSTFAGDLARALGSNAHDSDALLERRVERSIAEHFVLEGEEDFRAQEERLVVEVLAEAAERDCVALGGGSVTSATVRAALAAHTVILMDVPVAQCWDRVGGSKARPLAADHAMFAELYDERSDLYAELADVVIVAPRREQAPEFARELTRRRDGVVMLWAAAGGYPVHVGAGVLEHACDLWPARLEGSRAFLVADRTVHALYGGRIEAAAGDYVLEPGEAHKTLAEAERVWQALAGAGVTRADHLAALGGGVTGDLAGFCAATYQRGVPVVQLPTTLVAQVDSAYGGKTGIDLPAAKNYVGSYHQPAGVLADVATLDTLPDAEVAAGWVEVAKTALIAGGALWQRVLDGAVRDERTIVGCARTKLQVVARDERDAGARQVLNLGHTVGHAIETATGYRRYRHGEAVGLGLLAALRLSDRPDLRERFGEMMTEHHLPTQLEGAAPDAVLDALALDKKRDSAGVPFVLVGEPGEVTYGERVPQAAVRAAVEELCS